MPRVQMLDAAALALIVYDVVLLDDTDLGRATPCPGWTVADLVSHMDDQHEQISTQTLGPRPYRAGELRQDFAIGAARWTQAMTPEDVDFNIPGVDGKVPVRQVQAVHFIDMLTHRWDLARSLGQSSKCWPMPLCLSPAP